MNTKVGILAALSLFNFVLRLITGESAFFIVAQVFIAAAILAITY